MAAARDAVRDFMNDSGDSAPTLKDMQRVVTGRAKQLRLLDRTFDLDLVFLEVVGDLIRKKIYEDVLGSLPTEQDARTLKQAFLAIHPNGLVLGLGDAQSRSRTRHPPPRHTHPAHPFRPASASGRTSPIDSSASWRMQSALASGVLVLSQLAPAMGVGQLVKVFRAQTPLVFAGVRWPLLFLVAHRPRHRPKLVDVASSRA